MAVTILLDTNALLWWLENDNRLGLRARRDISNPTSKLYVSELTLFEIGIKTRAGKLRVDSARVSAAIEEYGMQLAHYDTWAMQKFVELPTLPWADPFDLSIMAQAIAARMPLLTSDQKILDNRVEDLLLLDARL